MSADLMPDETIIKMDGDFAAADPLASLTVEPVVNPVPDVERQLLVFRKIAAPLMAVVAGWNGREQGGGTLSQSAAQFAELIDGTIALNSRISQTMGLDQANNNARWMAASASAEIVAAHYRATSRTISREDAAGVVAALYAAIRKSLDVLAPPELEAIDSVSLLGRSLKALAPSASAIARFSFGRDPMELLAEVVRRLTAIAADVAAKLANVNGEAGMAGSPLYYAILEVAGEFYMESHFTEMDRLLEMAPEERKEYVQMHNRRIPMEPVWERLGLRMGMLEALTAYLPDTATGGGQQP